MYQPLEKMPSFLPDLQGKTPLEIRYLICQLEHSMHSAVKSGELVEREFPLQHKFKDGYYQRTIFLPAGTVVVGKIHKHEHRNKIIIGHVTVVTEAEGKQELWGPVELISPSACKRAIYVHDDTIWTVWHETNSKNLVEIEAQVIAKSYTELGLEDPVQTLNLLSVH